MCVCVYACVCVWVVFCLCVRVCVRGFGHLVCLLTHSFLTAKHLFPGFFTFFYAILNCSDLNMIAMLNSHLVVLHKETLKQHFEK